MGNRIPRLLAALAMTLPGVAAAQPSKILRVVMHSDLKILD